MKRDMDLIRSLLILAEEQPAGGYLMDASALDIDEVAAAEHVWLAREAGLVEASFVGDDPSSGIFALMRLTPAGHDFLAQARQPVLWNKAKETAGKAGVGLTVEVMKALLSQLAMKAIGIG